jgi:RimJ/RimL family protein N-acetyltransferase
MRTLRTGDLTLEPQIAAHAEALFPVLCDPALYEYENGPPASLEALRERFARLESRRSPDGHEHWLNWVIRLPGVGLVGFVQATVHADGRAAIAYVLGSPYWGRGLARRAVQAMLAELGQSYPVKRYSASLKRPNLRSLRLLERLGFSPATPQECERIGIDADEVLMIRDMIAMPEA